jgi:molybdate transport system substrate-binding protein
VGVLLSRGEVLAADLVILTNQGATPGVRELAAAFERASGHTVTVIQEEGGALEQAINKGAADLVTGNPGTIEALVKSGTVVASTVTPFVLAGLGLSVRAGAPKPDIRMNLLAFRRVVTCSHRRSRWLPM